MAYEPSLNDAVNEDNEALINDREDENQIVKTIEHENADASVNTEEDNEEDDNIDELLVDFDIEKAFSYCHNISCVISADKDKVIFELDFNESIPKSDDNNIYLFEFSTFEDEVMTEEKETISSVQKGRKVSFSVPYNERFLFSRFVPAILIDGMYVKLSDGKYINNPEILAINTDEYPAIDSKKGILLDANTVGKHELYDLKVRRAVYNIPLSLIIGETENEACPTIDYEYNGEIYHFNGFYCEGFDSLFSYLTEKGIHSTAIILNDWNKDYPEIIHPKARRQTGRSLYYAFNTEEEEGVRLMEATASFLASRYSSGEHGVINDWVIANEINQHKIWNYMDTSDLDYYTDSFEKSFRTFYNAIKSNYREAKVYFSLDHDWNDNYGNNKKFFNGRDILYKFNEAATRGGNYNWSLSIHPYPDPLTRVKFWNGKFDKTEEAKTITPMNFSSLTDVIKKDEFLDCDGNIRDIAVSELGFSSKSGEQLQAAAYAYCYYIIDNNEYISSFLMNRQTDDGEALKSGLRLGIYNYDYSPKYIKDVFRNIDSKDGDEFIPQMLEIIGADSLKEALSWAE